MIESVLLEADGPQVVLARDPVGTPYLALLIERGDDGDQFMASAVSTSRLADVLSGVISLRDAFVKAENGEVFACAYERISGGPTLKMSLVEAIPEAWLPAEGLLLSELLDDEPAVELLGEAAARNRAVVVVHLEPPEAYTDAKINADRLGDALRIFQNLTRHAYTKGAAALSEQWRKFWGGEDAHTLQVFAFSPGSFRVHFQAKEGADLSGLSPVGVALKKVDELTSHLDNPEAALEVFQRNRGHVVAAYQALLHFVVEQGTPFEYAWADLESHRTFSRRISPAAAEQLYELLVSRQELGKEEMVLVGAFSKVDEVGGTWTMRVDEKEVRGELAEGAGNLLYGVTIGAKLYRARCEERLEEVLGSGRQKTRILMLELNELTPASKPAV